ncbi:MAG TPA: right-handed parallel beta-helix repeat-containing protein, partial [Burkholderiales bacterium]
MRVQLSVVAASLAAAAVLTFPPAAFALSDLVINVDCAGGNRIADALSRPNVLDRRMIIVVNGTCTENVTIERDDVTLKAGASGGGVSAAVTTRPAIAINGARRIALESLSVTGGLHGVHATNGAAVAIRGGSVRNAARNGVFAFQNSTAAIDACTIENHGENGIAVVNASSASLTGSVVRGNALYGVVLSRAGGAILGNYDAAGNVCCGNTIENNVFDGVLAADASSVHLYGNTIQANGTSNGRWG